MDKDGSDEIDFNEFVLFMVFKFFDHDNDGYLGAADIENSMNMLGLSHRSHVASVGWGLFTQSVIRHNDSARVCLEAFL